ncbi:hypothetical protein SMACR_12876 [Sordaria macrospora]|uniref:Uncharacterized protein n=1 Tax=Sordaria macrospora TaxID=5147 RepID=A0A8S8ZF07_SORMA|nr:hypothetical protein SMACR_12876 [Sordaria macrospora]KAH7635925.1 hypothetical protein B0T09DRAFT_253843 [Sordaria sp. MPI-SDFR-AT-0083]WPJ64401.1 hypothetical protein SMAC4_12876 [Sordaria macrospora]
MTAFRPSPFRPTMPLRISSQPQTIFKTPATRSALLPRVVPGLVVFGAVYTVVSYIRSQLRNESNTLNRVFAQQNTPGVMEKRKERYLIETEGDPRKTIYNVLNW